MRTFNSCLIPKIVDYKMISTSKYYAAAIKSALLAVLILCTYSCSNNDSEPTGDGEAHWKISSTVKSVSGSSAIILSGEPGTRWYAELTEGAEWCSFSSKDFANAKTKNGQLADGLNVLYVYYKANTGKVQRHAQLTLRYAENPEKTFDLIQLAESEELLPAFNTWAELPAKVDNSNYQYVTHYGLLNNKTLRNYSICFDKTKKAALWVAYPIHDVYTTKNIPDRTNRWAFDPTIPISAQANCVEYSYKGSYDRGHQVASADRVCTDEMNAQTFYMSNMTPQARSLNGAMWGTLESRVRTNSCSDTLYVVTGAYFENDNTTTFDGAGNLVPIPTHYFKVLLRTINGKTGKKIEDCAPEELKSIGFWVEHKAYSGSIPTEICKSVKEIETKTGFTFFPKVAASVKEQNAPRDWGIN